MHPLDNPIMKTVYLIILFIALGASCLFAQELKVTEKQKQDIYAVIDSYTKAREKKDATLLESILTKDVDQLVSSGTWRKGKEASMKGMLRSSQSNPGKRTITIENLRLMTTDCAIADARYEIQNVDGTSRKMWSTFIAVYENDAWKITAIRNMLPAGQR